MFTVWRSNKSTKQLSALNILFPAVWISRARPPLTVGLLLICYKWIFLKIADFAIKLKLTALNMQLVPSKEFDLTELLEKAPPSGQTKVQTMLNDLNGCNSAKNFERKLTLEVILLNRLCEAQSSTWCYFRRWEGTSVLQQISQLSPRKRNLGLSPGSGLYRSYMFSSDFPLFSILQSTNILNRSTTDSNMLLSVSVWVTCVSCDGLATCPDWECCGTLCDLKSTIQHLIHLQIYFTGNPPEHETVACVSEPLTGFWLRRLQSTSRLRRSLVIFGNNSL